MPNRYFQTFPIINYANNQAVDITKRVVIQEKVLNNPYIYYPYEIQNNERADQLSYNYYEDSYSSWIVYLSNKILDPYYEWYLQDREFEEFIVKKYQKIEYATNKVSYYVNDWVDKENISVSTYDSLTPSMQKYWQSQYDVAGNISSYTRKQVDWKKNTNRVVSYQVSNTSFINDELCVVILDSSNTSTVAAGQVTASSNGSLFLQHIVGAYNGTINLGSCYVYGIESGVNTAITNTNITVVNNIPAEEEVYWKSVSYLDYEIEKNEYNKSLTILDRNNYDLIYENLKTSMAE